MCAKVSNICDDLRIREICDKIEAMSDKVRIQVSVEPELADGISKTCARLHVSRSAWLESTLANAVAASDAVPDGITAALTALATQSLVQATKDDQPSGK